METRSFLGKALFFIALIILATIVVFFVMNKDDIEEKNEETEIITSLNVDTYDYDMYVYDIDESKIYTSKYFYNKIYLDNKEVQYDEFVIDENSKFFLKNLSNTATDINNIKITYDPITKDEFEYLLENYSLLKTYVWVEGDTCDKVLLYSNNNVQLDLDGY